MPPIKKIMFVFGTRPEAIKTAPVVHALNLAKRWEVKVCVTAQHRQMLDQALSLFGIVSEITRLIGDQQEYQRMTQMHNPYGGGLASLRVCKVIQGLA